MRWYHWWLLFSFINLGMTLADPSLQNKRELDRIGTILWEMLRGPIGVGYNLVFWLRGGKYERDKV